jgi:hypothetical protein
VTGVLPETVIGLAEAAALLPCRPGAVARLVAGRGGRGTRLEAAGGRRRSGGVFATAGERPAKGIALEGVPGRMALAKRPSSGGQADATDLSFPSPRPWRHSGWRSGRTP